MKHIIVTFLLLLPIAANAQLSDEMLAILAMEEPSKSEAIAERRILIEEAMGEDKERIYRFICNRATEVNETGLVDTIANIKDRSESTLLDELSYGEFIYFSDCDGNRNAFEHNIYPTNLKYKAVEGLTPLTLYMIDEMGLLLLEKSPAGLTPTQIMNDEIRISYSLNSNEGEKMACVFSMIKREIQKALEQ